MAVCNPDLDFVCYHDQIGEPEYDENGTYFYPEIHHQRYVDEVDTCTTLDKNVLKEAILSFVSGHASTSFYAAVFLTIFMNSYITEWNVKILLQISHILLAIWISITRITDYMHHPEDVVFGCILGIFTALLVHRYSKKDEISSRVAFYVEAKHDLHPKYVQNMRSWLSLACTSIAYNWPN